jgi:alpha-tubulin suppressor-like RCC1 family protein
MTIVVALLAILVGLVYPNIADITNEAKQVVQNINAKVFKSNAIHDLVLNEINNIQISETVNLSTVGEIQDVVVDYEGTEDIKLMISVDGGNTWHSYTEDKYSSLDDFWNNNAAAVDLEWELIDYSTPQNIKDHALTIEDFNGLQQSDWQKVLDNASTLTFAFNAVDSEGNDITQEIDPELSIVVTGADGTESVVFPDNTSNTSGGNETSETSKIDITLPSDSNNLFADNTHRDNGDNLSNYDLVNANTDSATNFSYMFSNADEFNENLSSWNFANATDITNMVSGSGIDQANYNALVDAIYNTNTQGWEISDITNNIGTTTTVNNYTGSFKEVNNSLSKNIIAGYSQTVFLMEDGSVKATGKNNFSMFGDSFPSSVNYPTTVGISNVEQVSISPSYSLFLTKDGSVKASGKNYHSQIDNIGLSNVQQVAAAIGSSYFLVEDGSVKATGSNLYGQFGDGTTIDKNTPVDIGLSNVKQVSITFDHSLFLMNDGTVKSAGSNYSGELADGIQTDRINVVDTGLSNVKQVVAARSRSMFLMEDGTVQTIGWQNTGALGIGEYDGDRFSGTSHPYLTDIGLSNVKEISGGFYHTMFLMEDGSIKATGGNEDGQFGNGTTTMTTVPIDIGFNIE